MKSTTKMPIRNDLNEVDDEDAFILDEVEVIEESDSESKTLTEDESKSNEKTSDQTVIHVSQNACIQTNNIFTCDLCHKTFAKKVGISTHMRKSHGFVKFHYFYQTEDESKSNEKTSDQTATHVSQNVCIQTNNIFTCDLCHKTFPKKVGISTHMRKSHGFVQVDKLSYTCDECGGQFKIKYDLTIHCRKHLQTKSKTKEKKFFPLNFRSKRLRQKYLQNVLKNSTQADMHNMLKSGNESEEERILLPTDFGERVSEISKKNYVKKRTVKKSTSKPEFFNKFECAECGNKFTQRYNLVVHLKTVHKQTFIDTRHEKPFSCFVCEQRFCQKRNLKVHLKTIHDCTDVFVNNDKHFECSLCGNRFKRKHSLKVHVVSIHGQELEPKKNKDFACPSCRKRFSRKPNLLRHFLCAHPQSSYLECPICLRKFMNEDDMRPHIEKCNRRQDLLTLKHERTQTRVILQTVVCALCKLQLHKLADMRRHYQNDHDLDMTVKKLNFSNEDEFQTWKYEEETNGRCSYSRYRSYKVQAAKYVDFFCSRTGFYKNNNQGLRGRRAIGSKKINACCPAQIKVKHLNGQLFVKYLPTHVGHDNKLCYMNLTKLERELIIDELIQGLAPQAILQKMKYPLPACEEERRKIHLLTVQDIRNIAVTAGIDYRKGRIREPSQSVASVQSWVDEHPDSVLYYKARGQLDDRLQSLRTVDLLLIIMNEKQRQRLQKLAETGGGAVLVDTTPRTQKHDYTLTTLMVLDETSSHSGYPCCFMFANKVNDNFLTLFYECIHAKLNGDFLTRDNLTLRPKTLMAGVQEHYFTAWTQVFEPPTYRLYCPWRVLKHWRDSLNKMVGDGTKTAKNVDSQGSVNGVSDEASRLAEKAKKLKSEVYKFLKYDLMPARDVCTFDNQLEAFLRIENAALRTFQTFFERTYASTKERWAFCFRQQAGLRPNGFSQSFQKILKYRQTTDYLVYRLEQALAEVVAYMHAKDEEEILQEEKGVQDVQRLRTLRRRHAHSLSGDKMSIVALDGDRWIVPSGTLKTDELCESYCVKRRSSGRDRCVNCYLTCRECGVCLHDFECTCTDYCVLGNMCKHIHLLCQSVQVEGVSSTPRSDHLMLEHEEEVVFDLEMEGELETNGDEVVYEIVPAATAERTNEPQMNHNVGERRGWLQEVSESKQPLEPVGVDQLEERLLEEVKEENIVANDDVNELKVVVISPAHMTR